jgi:murein DD-endopeptidase MepM/ murein hydrolase activator NlpD
MRSSSLIKTGVKISAFFLGFTFIIVVLFVALIILICIIAVAGVKAGGANNDGVYFPIPYGFEVSYSDDFGAVRNRPNGTGYHQGNDIFGKSGFPIVACKQGEVTRIGWDQNGGWRVGITTEDGEYWYYAHMRKENPYAEGVKKGSKINAGQVIGYMGSTGYSRATDNIPSDVMPPFNVVDDNFAVHLHLGIRGSSGEYKNPYSMLKELQKNKQYVKVKKLGMGIKRLVIMSL